MDAFAPPSTITLSKRQVPPVAINVGLVACLNCPDV